MRRVFLLLHTQTVNSLSSYLLQFNTVPCTNPPLPEGRADIAEEPAESSLRLVNKCNVPLCTSYCLFCFSTSFAYIGELVRKANRKTVEQYSLCDHKTLAVHVIYSLLSLFFYFFRTFYPDHKVELWVTSSQYVRIHNAPFSLLSPVMSEQRAVLNQRSSDFFKLPT